MQFKSTRTVKTWSLRSFLVNELSAKSAQLAIAVFEACHRLNLKFLG